MNSIFIELKLDEATSNFQKSKERCKKGILDEKNKVVRYLLFKNFKYIEYLSKTLD